MQSNTFNFQGCQLSLILQENSLKIKLSGHTNLTASLKGKHFLSNVLLHITLIGAENIPDFQRFQDANVGSSEFYYHLLVLLYSLVFNIVELWNKMYSFGPTLFQSIVLRTFVNNYY